ncbi:hypothetical protein FACS189473_0950 [Spirochaetia bacterium]|nr:hypothetical protein FACS189473_0950 [Spirochaetia bacterium]
MIPAGKIIHNIVRTDDASPDLAFQAFHADRFVEAESAETVLYFKGEEKTIVPGRGISMD